MLRNIIVIGASAGGFSAVGQLVSRLPGTIDASAFVVLHLSNMSNAVNMVMLWQKKSELICTVPASGDPIRKGYLYLAPSNHHMLISDDTITIKNGPRENRYRPSIDILFHSAAVHYGSRVIGIVLSGALNDGTSGMSAIKKCGGICIVQDPDEAEFNNMPQSVLNFVDVDYKARLNDIGYVIGDILSRPLPENVRLPHKSS